MDTSSCQLAVQGLHPVVHLWALLDGRPSGVGYGRNKATSNYVAEHGRQDGTDQSRNDH